MIKKDKYIIALAAGELAETIQKYLRGFGIEVDMSEDAKLCQQYGNVEFRIVRSREVPKFFGRWDEFGIQADFGITGRDCCEDELIFGGNFKYLSGLDFGKGSLVLYTRKDVDLNKVKDLTMVVSDYYTNLAKLLAKDLNCRGVLEVKGKTEGYVSSGEVDLGFDSRFTGGTIDRQENLKIIKEVMKTQTVVIGRPGYMMEDFILVLYNINK